MTSFYSREALVELGLRSVGTDVYISHKASIYGASNISIGDNVRIDDFCILSGHIELGSFIHIAAYTALYGGDEGIFISDLSSRICVYSVSYDYSGGTLTNPMVPDNYKNIESKPVYIGKHAIIGSTSIVLPGVRIAEGSSFGSFSFINRDSEPWSINVGIPFRKIRNRSQELLKLEAELLYIND